MKDAKVLYVNITGISAEILKNLVLAGIRAEIWDNRPTSAASPNVLWNHSNNNPPNKKAKLTIGQAVKSQVEDLNPLLGDCPILEMDNWEEVARGIQEHTIVVASQIDMTTARGLCRAATAKNGKFFLCDTFGWNGACCMDLGRSHTYRPEIGKNLGDPTTLKDYVDFSTLLSTELHECVNRFHKTPPETYVQYRCLLEYREQLQRQTTKSVNDTVDDFIRIVRAYLETTKLESNGHALISDVDLRTLWRVSRAADLAPVCSVLGGLIGNEIIKAISGKGEPANNTILLDGLSCKAWHFLVRPK